MAIPEALSILSPQVLLLRFLNIKDFVLVNTLLLYAVGYWGCLSIARRYRLSPVIFFFNSSFSILMLLHRRLLTPGVCGGVWPWMLTVFADPARWMALGWHLLAFGFLPLLGGRLAIPAAMAVGVAWLSNSSSQQHISIHYPFTVYPLLALASIRGGWRLAVWLSVPVERVATGRFLMRRHRVAWGVAIAGLAASVASAWALNPFSVWMDVFGGVDVITHANTALQAHLDAIPREGRLTTVIAVAPHVSRRADLSLVVRAPCGGDWIALRMDGMNPPLGLDASMAEFRRLLAPGSGYGFRSLPGSVLGVFGKGRETRLNAPERDDVLNSVEAELRLGHHAGHLVHDEEAGNGLAWYAASLNPAVAVCFGPYVNLPAGRYTVVFRLRTHAPTGQPVARLEVTELKGTAVRGATTVAGPHPRYADIPLTVDLEGAGDVEFRCFKTGSGEIWIDRVEWREQ